MFTLSREPSRRRISYERRDAVTFFVVRATATASKQQQQQQLAAVGRATPAAAAALAWLAADYLLGYVSRRFLNVRLSLSSSFDDHALQVDATTLLKNLKEEF